MSIPKIATSSRHKAYSVWAQSIQTSAIWAIFSAFLAQCVTPPIAIPKQSPPLETAKPLPKAPPGQKTVRGPITLERVQWVRSAIGWNRDYVSATRNTTYDLVLAQQVSLCPDAAVLEKVRDTESCEGALNPPKECTVQPPYLARVSVEISYQIETPFRCQGRDTPHSFSTTSDVKNQWTAAAIECFRSHNKHQPEESWTPMFKLVEIKMTENIRGLETIFPRLVAHTLLGKSRTDSPPLFCRDDGASLDGVHGRMSTTDSPPAASLEAQLKELDSLAPLTPKRKGEETPLTSEFKSEHDLWEQCNQPDIRDHTVVQQRCQLLRQLDKLVREAEDAARIETPKGQPAPISSGAP